MKGFAWSAASVVVLAAFIAAAAPVHAQGLDRASAEALAATLRLLSDPGVRNQTIATDRRAAEIDSRIRAMAASPALTQEFYELAADIFAELARNTRGSERTMSDALERAKADPSAFAATLSPRTLRRLRELAVQLSDVGR